MTSRAPAARPPAAGERSLARALRMLVGGLLVLLVVAPLYRLLTGGETGLAGRATVDLADIAWQFSWSGLLLVLPVAIVAARMVTPAGFDRFAARLAALLLRPRARTWLMAWALVGGALTAAFSLLVLEGRPNLVDAFAQLLHARYWAEGMLTGPREFAPFWAIQNSLFTPEGWVSQYPPGHIALLVPFLKLGVPWLLGPLLVAATVIGAGALARRLFPDDPVIARLGSALVALSPFFLFLSGAYMNHATTAACVTIGACALLRAWDGHARWAIAAGFLFALSLATRPLSTVAMGTACLVLVPLLWRRSTRRLSKTAALGLLGALPVLGLWLAYNDRVFGSPFTLGYSVALGPSMALGFHRDPWGNWYGVREAVAYTSSDLTTLGINLFETPVSAVLVIGVFLLFSGRLRRGAWLLLALAVAPVLSNALYWHHGIFMGPRMLHEAAPFWVLLFVVAAVGLVRRVPPALALGNRYYVRPAIGSALIAAFAIGFLYMGPVRARSYGGGFISVARTAMPDVRGPALVFVHDAWAARIGMTLAAAGMRLDLIETLVRQNSTCRLHELARAVAAGDSARAAGLLAVLDTVPRARDLPTIVEIAPGDNIRIVENQRLTEECRRQALSDRFGILDITPLLWQAELHGMRGDGMLIVRDLGPQENAKLLARYPNYRPYVYVREEAAPEGVRLWHYEEAMRELWSPPEGTRMDVRIVRDPSA